MIRRSVRSDVIPFPAVSSKASAVNSTVDTSINARAVSLARWNNHYLIPKLNTGDDGTDPTLGGFPAPNYWAPDWVVVTRNGPKAFTSWSPDLADSIPTNDSYAIGRYAYVIYDEGGLLDMNAAGLPAPAPSVPDVGRKGVISLADLTAMKITPTSQPTASSISKIVAWRYFVSLPASGVFPASIKPPTDPASYLAYVLEPTRDFKSISPPNTPPTPYRTDQAIVSRKELIDLVKATASVNMLQFIGTFSREKNLPTWNTGIGAVTLTERFALGRLALLKQNPDPANAADIQKYFGLKWEDGVSGTVTPPVPSTPGHWNYVGSTGSVVRSDIPVFTTNPEFFQLLNYAVYSRNNNDPDHIATTLTLGASIIDQYDDDTSSDSVTGTTSTIIQYNGGWAVGMENTDPARPSPSPQPSPFPPPAGMSPTPRPFLADYVMLNRPFRNTGEIGYALRPELSPAPITVDFQTAASSDAPILDLFTYNTAALRAGTVNLNTQNPAVIAAILKAAITNEAAGTTSITLAPANNAAASPTPGPMTTGVVGSPTLGTLVTPALGRADIARLTAAAGNTISSSSDEAKESIARALSEVTQTRSWGLFIDLVAQSGRYPPTASALKDFVVDGEKRYWLHIAIDRFTGEVIDRELEEVKD